MSVNFTLLDHLEWWFFGGLPVIKTRQDQFCIMRHHLTIDCSFFIFFVFKTNNRFLEPTRFSNLVQILWKINCANSSLLILATVTLWNNLPSYVVLSPSVNWFGTRVLAIRLNTINHWVPQIHVFNLHVCLYCSPVGFITLCTCSTPVLHHCQSVPSPVSVSVDVFNQC